MKRLLLFCLFLMLSGSICVHAGFVSGLETFDGTTKDTGTWGEYLPSPSSSIVQNDAVILAQLCEYQTLHAVVAKGETVIVEIVHVTCFESYDFHDCSLVLTENSTGAATDEGFKAAITHIYSPPDQSNYDLFWSGYATGEGISYTPQTIGGIPLGTYTPPFSLEITTELDDTIHYTAYDADEDIIFLYDLSVPWIPENLYIRLCCGYGGSATFDNVYVIPEPATLLLLGFGTVMLKKRKT